MSSVTAVSDLLGSVSACLQAVHLHKWIGIDMSWNCRNLFSGL
jgi:hypothetical protein